jgi:hypothetical protein
MKIQLGTFFKIITKILKEVFQKKYLKYHALVITVSSLMIFLTSQGYITFKTEDHKISKNTELRDMFHQNRSQHHLDEANKNWAEKFFNISFD